MDGKEAGDRSRGRSRPAPSLGLLKGWEQRAVSTVYNKVLREVLGTSKLSE